MESRYRFEPDPEWPTVRVSHLCLSLVFFWKYSLERRMPVASRGFFLTVMAGIVIGATVGFYLKDKEEIKGLVS